MPPRVAERRRRLTPRFARSGGSAAIRGPWCAVRMESADQESPAAAVHQLTLVVDEKTFVMRLGQKLIAETPYSVDAGQNPRHQADLRGSGDPRHLGTQGRYAHVLPGRRGPGPSEEVRRGTRGRQTLTGVPDCRRRGENTAFCDGRGRQKSAAPVALAEYTAIGSPSWSPDGKRIAFDAWRTVFGESYGDSHVFVTNADGSAARDIGDGTFPSWSPDGKRLAMGRYGTNRGVWITSADGTRKELLDPAGWGIKFCPTANRVAYTTYGSSGATFASAT